MYELLTLLPSVIIDCMPQILYSQGFYMQIMGSCVHMYICMNPGLYAGYLNGFIILNFVPGKMKNEAGLSGEAIIIYLKPLYCYNHSF